MLLRNGSRVNFRKIFVGTVDLRSPAAFHMLLISFHGQKTLHASEAFIQTDNQFINLCPVWCRVGCVCKVKNLNEKAQQQ